MQETTIFTISQEDVGMRLDRWIKTKIKDIPQGMIEKCLRKGSIKVNGSKIKSNYRLAKDDNIAIKTEIAHAITYAKEQKSTPNQVSEESIRQFTDSIIYEDRDLLVINKPQGLAVQGGSKIKISVADIISNISSDKEEVYKIVHRIDKNTSGVLIVAKNDYTARELTRQFRERLVKKQYIAIVAGVPKQKEGVISIPLTKIKEKVISDLEGDEAITNYKLLNSNKNLSIIQLSPLTGRTHQLRVHMKELGTPILGDGKYGGHKAYIEGYSKNMHLHAYKIVIDDFRGKRVEFEGQFPSHMEETMQSINKAKKR